MKESDEYRLGQSAALRGEPLAKYQSLTARMNPKKRAAFVQGFYDGLKVEKVDESSHSASKECFGTSGPGWA